MDARACLDNLSVCYAANALMRFYLDEDLSDQVARLAREAGLDVLSSHECGRDGLSDEEQLRQASEEGRIFVTHNHRDFVRLTVLFFQNQWPHAGVLLLPRSLRNHDFAAIASALSTFADSHPNTTVAYTIQFLNA